MKARGDVFKAAQASLVSPNRHQLSEDERAKARRRSAETRRNTPEKFWAKVDKTPGYGPDGDCWPWNGGGLSSSGYIQWQVDGKSAPGHRYAWELENGPMPANLEACHKCDVRHCARPSHVYAGTEADNARDRQERGRWRGGRRKGERHPQGCGHCEYFRNRKAG